MVARLVAGLLLGTLLVLLGPVPTTTAATTPTPRSLEAIEASLRDDPILVTPAMGTGDTAGVHDLLTELAAEVDAPVYVVLTTLPDDLANAEQPAQQAAALLSRGLGDGIYVIHFTADTGFVGAFGSARDIDTGPGQRAYSRSRNLGPHKYNQPTAALEAELVLRSAASPSPGREISDDQLRTWLDTPRAFVPNDQIDREDVAATRWVIALAAAVAVLLGGLTLTKLATSAPMPHRRKRAADAPAAVVTSVDDAVLPRTRRRFEQLRAADLASPFATRAEEALTAAELAAATGDATDAVGAWVLAEIARRELERIERPNRSPWRPCVVDPRHGEAATTVRLADSSIDAPACTACGTKQGTFLTVRTWRGERAYLDTTSVWARTGFGALVDDLPRQVIADRRAGR